VGTQDIDTEILISPNMTGLILGSDWMEENECVFDCKRKQVCVNNEWIALKREPVDRRIDGTYVTATTQFSASSVDRVARPVPNSPPIMRIELTRVPKQIHDR